MDIEPDGPAESVAPVSPLEEMRSCSCADPPARPGRCSWGDAARGERDTCSIPGGQSTAWVFNPEYQRPVDLWEQVMPEMERITKLLERPYTMARSADTWQVDVAERYVQQISEVAHPHRALPAGGADGDQRRGGGHTLVGAEQCGRTARLLLNLR